MSKCNKYAQKHYILKQKIHNEIVQISPAYRRKPVLGNTPQVPQGKVWLALVFMALLLLPICTFTLNNYITVLCCVSSELTTELSVS